MRILGQIIFLLAIISCTPNKDKKVANIPSDSVSTADIFILLNYLLTDTVEIGLVKDGYRVISDIDMLPPPMLTVGVSFKKSLSEVLSEDDTLHIIEQLKARKTFRTDELTKYGFMVAKISELQSRKLNAEMFWDKIHKDYGPSLLTVSRPIFNKEFTKAYIRFGYLCGEMCGGGEDMIIEKVNNKWIIRESLGFWEI